MRTFIIVCGLSIVVVAIGVMIFTSVAAFRKKRALRRESMREQAQNERREARLFSLRETLKRMLTVNVVKIAAEQGMTKEEVEKRLNFPSLWQAYDLAGTDLKKLLAVGKRIWEVGGVPAVGGLEELWLETMNQVVHKTDALELMTHLEDYKDSFPCTDYDLKITATYCTTAETCLRFAPYLHLNGRNECWKKFNECIGKLAAECHTPRDVLALLATIPAQKPNQVSPPLNTSTAIHTVLIRVWQIYGNLIETATDYSQIQNLILPDRETYAEIGFMVELHANLAKKQDQLLTQKLRLAAQLQ